ncbi:MAG TPA: PorP/SprF family type IX secretion system membrane protein, partial [Bacteroidales bacterium]
MLRKNCLYHLRVALVLALILGTGCFSELHSQDPIFSQFMFNQLYFNPAFAGNTPYPRLIGGYRNQWPGIGNAYVSYYASFDQYVDALDGGLGLGITKDNQAGGVFTKTAFDLIYSHPIEFTYDITANLGFQASLVQKKVNGSGVTLGDQSPYQTTTVQEVIPDQSKIYADFSAG